VEQHWVTATDLIMSALAFTDLADNGRSPPVRIRALISMLRTEDGGRRTGIRSGYRPNHNFGSAEGRTFYIGQIDFPGETLIEPGQAAEMVVTFIPGPGLQEALQLGRCWRIQEGPKLVATGKVTELLGKV